MCDPTFSSWESGGGGGGGVSPQRGPGQSTGGNVFWQKNLLKINVKSGLFSVAVYTPNSDPISEVH